MSKEIKIGLFGSGCTGLMISAHLIPIKHNVVLVEEEIIRDDKITVPYKARLPIESLTVRKTPLTRKERRKQQRKNG